MERPIGACAAFASGRSCHQTQRCAQQGATAGAILVAAVPAIVLGWYATTTIVAVVDAVVALLLAVAVPVVRPRTDDPAEMDGLDAQDLVDLQL